MKYYRIAASCVFVFTLTQVAFSNEDFESFSLGPVDGQSDWAGTLEAEIVDSDVSGFGSRSLRIETNTSIPFPEFRSPDLANGFGRFSLDLHIGSAGAQSEYRLYGGSTYLAFLPGGQLGMPRNVGLCSTNTFLVDGMWTPDATHRLEWVSEQGDSPNGNDLTIRLDDQLVYEGSPQDCTGGHVGPIGVYVFGGVTPDITIDNISSESFLPGPDFDRDGDIDIVDIDDLVEEIMFNILTNQPHPKFDLNGDGSVDSHDVDAWLAAAGAANLPSKNPYLRGDANLDGVVDVADFNIWNENKFVVGGLWSAANFNADPFTDVSDFNMWNANKFTSSDITVIPEPAAFWPLLTVAVAWLLSRRSS